MRAQRLNSILRESEFPAPVWPNEGVALGVSGLLITPFGLSSDGTKSRVLKHHNRHGPHNLRDAAGFGKLEFAIRKRITGCASLAG
jgi:hypothetical protein